MNPRKLTQQEADKLFEETFLRLHRQNIAQKQKNKIDKLRTVSYSVDLTNDSPKKSPLPVFSASKSCLLQISPIKLQGNPERNFLQSHKISTYKQQLIQQIKLVEEPQQLLKDQFEENNINMSNRSMSIELQKSGIFSSEMQIQSPIKKLWPGQQNIETLYLESQIKEVKRDLEIKYRGKLCRTGQINGYKFSCKNDNKCPFDCVFQYFGMKNTMNEKLYRLIMKNPQHINACIEEEQQVIYMKLTKTIDSMEESIISLLNAENNLKPKEILNIMAQKMGQNSHKFIYKGLTSKQYHKAAKKYFDNLIYKIKNQIGIL